MCKSKKIINIKSGIELDESKILNENGLLVQCPHLFEIIDLEKNEEIGIDIYSIYKSSNKKVWFYCEKCEDSYPALLNNKVKGTDCSICTGRYVTPKNSLATLNPSLASEWHPTKNGNLTPNDYTSRSGKSVWWMGTCGHEWKDRVVNRFDGKNCPICSGKKLLVGYNDMWTTNPELAKLLANPEDGYKYMQSSKWRVDWKCNTCNQIIKNKSINHISRFKLVCPICSDFVTYSEKIMYHVLKQLNIDFLYDVSRKWSGRKRYDFIISSFNMIIETHGMQHYEESTRKGSRTLKEEQENDELKKQLAIENGIEHYIVIDARYSEFEYIKNNILNSELKNLFNFQKVNWNDIFIDSQKSMHIEVLDLWNEGMSVKDISKEVKLHNSTIVDILIKFHKNKMTTYTTEIAVSRNANKVYQFDKNDLTLVRIWNGTGEISRELGYLSSGISEVCLGGRPTYKGFIWKYEKDLDESLKTKYNIS